MTADGSNCNGGWRRRSSIWSTASGSSRFSRLLRKGSTASGEEIYGGDRLGMYGSRAMYKRLNRTDQALIIK